MSHGSVLIFGLGGVCIALPVTCSASPAVFQPPLLNKLCCVSSLWHHCASFWLQFPSPICDVSCVFDVSLSGVSRMLYFSSGQPPMQTIDCFSFLTPLVCFRIGSILGIESLDFSRAERNRSVCSMRTSSNSLLWHPRSQLKLEGVIDFLIELGGSLLFLYRNSNKWIK